MDTFWIIAAALIMVLMGLMVRILVTRRRYQRSGMVFRRNTVGKSYFDRNKNCHAYTRQVLEKLAPGRVLASLRFPCVGGEALVGLVMVHATGVYIFAIKDYGGILNGGADSEYWTLTFENGRTENLYNPLLQGRATIRAVEELLAEIEYIPVYLYVVFGQRCRFGAVPEPANHIALVLRPELKSMLEKDLAERQEVLSPEKANAVLKKLESCSLEK